MAEFDLIEKYFAPLSIDGLKDDCAVLDIPAGKQLVVSSDTSNRGDHFVEEMSPFDAARKCLRSNVSDLAASGADLFTYQLNLALPKDIDEEWLAEFARGLAADQEEFGIALSGGDTTGMQAGGLSVSITAMGLVPEGEAVKRGGAKEGDLVVLTGPIGDACLDRLRIPSPPCALAPLIRKYAHAGVDLSDGLPADLGHIARHSALGAQVYLEKIPFSEKVEKALADDRATPQEVLTWGEDYELCLTVPENKIEDFQFAADNLDVELSVIGKMVAGSGVEVFDASEKPLPFTKMGWTHF